MFRCALDLGEGNDFQLQVYTTHYRITPFCNIQFLDCTLVDVDFEEVAMRNSLIADTTLLDCSITGSVFDSAS
jgi:hypothetical protein